MNDYKKDFIEFMLDCEVLRFGDFVTKSGRNTPFFINTGFYRKGSQVAKLAKYYATAIYESFGKDIDIIFGPAYKGIPLAVSTVMALNELYGLDVGYCSNRKEIKDHGDKGILLGSPITDGAKVVIIEDVVTAGTSISETMPILQAQGNIDVKGLIVSVNRMEKGQGELSALDEIKEKYNIMTTSIVTIEDIIEHLYNNEINGKVYIDEKVKLAMDDYYQKYGAKK